jgi:hypothetical protein
VATKVKVKKEEPKKEEPKKEELKKEELKKEELKKEEYQPTINFENKVRVSDAIYMSIDKVGAKKVLKYIMSLCLRDSFNSCRFPMSLLATKQDEEKAEVASLLFCLMNDEKEFKKVSDEGMKMIDRKLKEEEEKKKNE